MNPTVNVAIGRRHSMPPGGERECLRDRLPARGLGYIFPVLARLDMPPLPPAIGRYEIRERIGQGGMGALYLALDPAIDRLVALKLLRIDSDEMRARFLREARSAGRLQHPHIVTVYDVGEHDGQPFIAMEYVQGETLGEIIRRRAPVPLSQKLSLMEDLCDGLNYAHGAGLVHRDIKPANLMVTNRAEDLKILDFGIARGAGDSGLTEVGTMMGTPNYMSPEQASGKPVDRRSDIFAVGAVIYEMLAYRQAFPGKEWQVVLPAILEKSPEPMAQVDRALDPRLDGIVGRALARDPGERYQNLRLLRDDLADFRKRLDENDQETAPSLFSGCSDVTAPDLQFWSFRDLRGPQGSRVTGEAACADPAGGWGLARRRIALEGVLLIERSGGGADAGYQAVRDDFGDHHPLARGARHAEARGRAGRRVAGARADALALSRLRRDGARLRSCGRADVAPSRHVSVSDAPACQDSAGAVSRPMA